MKYSRFEELPVWQAAMALAERVFEMSRTVRVRAAGDLMNRLQRATLSISNNIAEGFERGTTKELLTFLYIARGSAGEVRSMLCLMERLPDLTDLRSEISDLKSSSESISRQLRGWADHLQNSGIKGQRHLTREAREHSRRKREADEFVAHLKEVTRRGRSDG